MICTHSQIYPGLDCAYCCDCGQEFLPGTALYESYMRIAPDKKTVSGANCNPSAPDTVSAKHNHWVETYAPAKRDAKYYRYVWMEGRKLKHLHLPGGNAKSAAALVLKQKVESAIASGKSPAMIEQLILESKLCSRH